MATSFFDRENTVAPEGYDRFLVPPAALAVHLSIGQAYAFSTFNLPLTKLIGITHSAPADWKLTDVGWTFSIAIAILGLSAAVFGRWVERAGPRKSMFVAALCFGSGFIVSAIGIHLHQLVILYLGYGVLGGCGLGIGYISPVSTLIKWFPDRPGMATGMAIMGFGGGAFLAGYLNAYFMGLFGVARTVIMLGFIYFILMIIGARIIRRPPLDWKPAGWTPPVRTNKMVTGRSLNRNDALGTVQFYLLWGILFINVTAGIGILAQASPMMQDMFRKTALEAGAIVSLISLFNAGGRFFWASLSDYIGRRNTYFTFFVVQVALFRQIPSFAAQGAWMPFEIAIFTVFTMYGGGFATIPAFVADIFGEENVGAIHGALLTAWSAAAVAGPVIITQLSERAKAGLAPGESRVHIYDQPLRVLAYLLVVGFILTLLVRPLKYADCNRK
jgi:MFS family permease